MPGMTHLFADSWLVDFFKLVLYLTFFCVLCMFYGMPIHIIRDVALTIRSFYKRIGDFVRYRQATKDMNDRYPDATPEEVAREDVCIICREDMRAWAQRAQDPNAPAQPPPSALDERTRPKKLPCGHILHFACLRSWLERQQNCPTCRRPVLVAATGNSSTAGNQNAGAGPIHGQQQPPHVVNIPGQQPVIAHNVLNLGPFRLAWGARIAAQGVPPAGNNNLAAGNQQGQAANPQGFGGGFGLFRPPQQRTSANFSPQNVQSQLQQIEQQILREVNALRVQADQLYLVRSLQGELARLRIQQAQGNHMPGGPINNQHGQPATVAPNLPQNLPIVFAADQQHQSLGPNHPNLPRGMTLPEGWTVLPLQRVNQINPVVSNSTSSNTLAHSPAVATESSPSQGAAVESSSGVNPEISAAATPEAQHNEYQAQPVSSMPTTNGDPSPLPVRNEANVNTESEPPQTTGPEQAPQDPSSPLIPSWGSATTSFPNRTENAPNASADSSNSHMNGNAISPGNADDREASTSERKEDKGKGRAVTIEDAIDDVD